MFSIQRKPPSTMAIKRPLLLKHDVRNMGIHIVAGKGSGKSRLMGRTIGYHDFLGKIPLIILDPHGTTIDNFLDKLTYLSADQQRRVVDRLLYVDVSGRSGYVPALPLYYRKPGDSLLQAAQRFLNVVKKLDPDLTSAPILGWNAIERVGTNVGMVLVALSLPITEAPSLLRQTQRWLPRLRELAEQQPEAKPAVDYFLHDYLSLEVEQCRRESESFLSKVLPFSHDARMQAMFASPITGIDWQQVVNLRQVVMLDFRDEDDPQQIRFKMLWLLNSLLEYIKRRGPTRKSPISVIVDELAYLLALNSSGHDLLSADLDDLINKIARNNNVWLTLAHQEMYQVPKTIQKTLMTMGTQVIGVTTDEETALEFAKRYFAYDPNLVRKYQPVYHQAVQIDQTSVEFTAEEQLRLNSYRFTNVQPYQFWVAPCVREGSAQTTLQLTDTSRYDRGKYVNEPLVRELRSRLVRRSSLRVDRALELIRRRQNEFLPTPAETAEEAKPKSQPQEFLPPPQRVRRKKKT
jgi:hypothetical protein